MDQQTTSAAYRLIERAPTLAEYRALCEAVGWGNAINFAAAQQSLDRSLYHVVVAAQEQMIGMGHIVGDGAIYFYLQDIAVLPAYQRRGIGRLIMDRLMGYLKQHAPDQAFVGLFAAEGSALPQLRLRQLPGAERHVSRHADQITRRLEPLEPTKQRDQAARDRHHQSEREEIAIAPV